MTSRSLFNYLDAIRLRPGMYVGFDEAHRGEQLERLDALISGYRAAVEEHAVHDAGMALYAEFSDYLRGTYGWSASRGAIPAVREHSDSDSAAWERFWTLLEEFKRARS